MTTTLRLAALGGDGIGPEVTEEALRVLTAVAPAADLELEIERHLVGSAAFDAGLAPLPAETLAACRAADAVLLGAVGDPRHDHLPPSERPERALLELRSELGLWLNLRPAWALAALAGASPLRSSKTAGARILVVRELGGGIYYGQPRGRETTEDGSRRARNTMVYDEHEIARTVRAACRLAQDRSGRVCSVDKANVLEVSALWREVATEVGAEFPDVSLEHALVDSTALRLVTHPNEFDVVVTANAFGDILSDVTAALGGSLGLLPSASLGDGGVALYEPVHGSAPDLAGRGVANPTAAILSAAMLLRHSADRSDVAAAVERALESVLADGYRTPDLVCPSGGCTVGTSAFGAAVAATAARFLERDGVGSGRAT